MTTREGVRSCMWDESERTLRSLATGRSIDGMTPSGSILSCDIRSGIGSTLGETFRDAMGGVGVAARIGFCGELCWGPGVGVPGIPVGGAGWISRGASGLSDMGIVTFVGMS